MQQTFPDRYTRLVLAFERSVASLRMIFQEILDDLCADSGFIGHEDLEGKIRLVISQGRYFHLASSSGFAGQIFRTKAAGICDLKSPLVERPTTEVVAEMGAPIRFEGRTIGVLIIDRHTGEAFCDEDLERLEAFAKLVGQHIDSSSAPLNPIDETDLTSLLANGKLAFEEGSYESAEQLLLSALRIDPANLASLHVLGEIYIHTRQWKAAKEMLQKALEIEPGLTRAAHHLRLLAESTASEEGGEQ